MADCNDCSCCYFNFSDLSLEELDFLKQGNTTVTVKKGENIVKQNTYITSISCVIDGMFSIILEGERGRNLCIGIGGNNDLVGVTDLLTNEHHSYTAITFKKTSICIFEKKNFMHIMENNDLFRKRIFEKYAAYIKDLHSRLMIFGTKQMHGRLADTLLYLCELKKNIPDLFDYISRKDIAAMTGTSVETIVRLLKEFNHDGLIKIAGRDIGINNFELLQKLRKIG